MKTLVLGAALTLSASILTACGDGGSGPHGPAGSVQGTMSFVLGGTSPSSPAPLAPRASVGAAPASLTAGQGYMVSPRKARIAFAGVTFRGKSGETLGTSDFTACTVTYDRSLSSGATLLDCPFTVPVGDIHQIAISFDRTLQLLVSDPQTGIYSDPSSTTGYSTTAPAGGAAYVPLVLGEADASGRANAQVVFASPVAVAEGSTPRLYITTDMIQTLHLVVDAGGATLSPVGGNQGTVALFGGLSPGSSQYYSNAGTLDTYRVGSVDEFHEFRIFYDQAGNPLYLTSPTCGIGGPRGGAWASPPIDGNIGGSLGRDSNRVLAWVLRTDAQSSAFAAYFVMPEASAVGQTTTMSCKRTTTPPTPADGKTYASGAPAMPTADSRSTMMLQAK